MLGLLLISLLLLFAVNEYEKSMNFQWENMVQPHWEGVVPQTPLLLPLANEKTDEIVVSPDFDEVEEDIETPVEKNRPVDVVKKPTEVKKSDVVKTDTTKTAAASAAKNTPQKPEPVQKAVAAKKKSLHLRVKEDLYYGHTARWEMKKQKVMPDFFAPKPQEQGNIQLGGHLIMEDDESLGGGRRSQNDDTDYLDAIKGAELNISIKMR